MAMPFRVAISEMTTEVTPKSSEVRRIISSTFLVAMGSKPVVGSS